MYFCRVHQYWLRNVIIFPSSSFLHRDMRIVKRRRNPALRGLLQPALVVKEDPEKLGRVFSNIIDNALKYK